MRAMRTENRCRAEGEFCRYHRHDPARPAMAEALRRLREQRFLTQFQASERCGVQHKTLASYESGARIERMKVVELMAILAAYGITISQFFWRVEEIEGERRCK